MHGDHFSEEVARLFLAHEKPVIAPEGVSKGTHPRRSTTAVHEIRLGRGTHSLKVVAYPGHQGTALINNVYLIVTPEGFSVLHTGDQSGSEAPGGDFDWIDKIGRERRVDVLLPNCWTTNPRRMARGVNPRLIITGHENEMGHGVDQRKDYAHTYNVLFGAPCPFVVMGWGEGFHYAAQKGIP